MQVLDKTQLAQIAPAAFCVQPSDSVSDRYRFISTERILDRMENKGWVPVRAAQSQRSRFTDHGTHTITFREAKNIGILQVGDIVPEVTAVNNHMGRSCQQFLAALFRCFCNNQCVSPYGSESGFSQRHSGSDHDIDKAIDGSLNNLDQALAKMDKWQKITLTNSEQAEFAAQALELRDFSPLDAASDANRVLLRKRDADLGTDLWTVYNVVQEKLLRGFSKQGLVRGKDGVNRIEWITTRKIVSIDRGIELNQALWRLAESFE